MLATLCYVQDSFGILDIFMCPVDLQTVAGFWVVRFDDDSIVIGQKELSVKGVRYLRCWFTRVS